MLVTTPSFYLITFTKPQRSLKNPSAFAEREAHHISSKINNLSINRIRVYASKLVRNKAPPAGQRHCVWTREANFLASKENEVKGFKARTAREASWIF